MLQTLLHARNALLDIIVRTLDQPLKNAVMEGIAWLVHRNVLIALQVTGK